VDATTPLQTVFGMATQSKWEVDTNLINHSKFIVLSSPRWMPLLLYKSFEEWQLNQIEKWTQSSSLKFHTCMLEVRNFKRQSPCCHGSCHHSVTNCFWDGNSIKVRSGHKPHKPFKIHSKPHILEVGTLNTHDHTVLGSLRNIQHKHACWTSHIILTGVKACKQLHYYSLRAGNKARIANLNCIH